jgi:hypothetical protein
VGAINRDYDLGSGVIGHERIKEDGVVFNDFLPLLNSLPPAPMVKIIVDKDSGRYDSPLSISPTVDPPQTPVRFVANRVTKQVLNGFMTEKTYERLQGRLGNGHAVRLSTDGMWDTVFAVQGTADDVKRTYWLGVDVIHAAILTDNSTPFEGTLVVVARTTNPRARIYHSLDNERWNEGANVTLRENAVVYVVAVDPFGIASEVVSRAFKKRVAWDDAVTATVNEHFIAGRIDVNDYLSYSRQFGFFTPITLYSVNGVWVLDPYQPEEAIEAVLARSTASREHAAFIELTDLADRRPMIRVEDRDPQPGRHSGPLTVTIQARDLDDGHITVHYTLDGSIPDENTPAFQDQHKFTLAERGNHAVACYAKGRGGHETYETFHYAIGE